MCRCGISVVKRWTSWLQRSDFRSMDALFGTSPLEEMVFTLHCASSLPRPPGIYILGSLNALHRQYTETM
jgi:hypothetical protein